MELRKVVTFPTVSVQFNVAIKVLKTLPNFILHKETWTNRPYKQTKNCVIDRLRQFLLSDEKKIYKFYY